jgi:hypothetical protein
MTNGKTTTIEPPEAVPGAAQGRAHDKKAMSFSVRPSRLAPFFRSLLLVRFYDPSRAKTMALDLTLLL